MQKHLVIVESPSKSKTIEKYLGKEYKVVSSKGHIRDLSTKGKFGLGVDVENDFQANYIPISQKKALIKELKKDVKESDKVYLATDPDREGEAISWHLKDALGIKDDSYERVLFHEITKDKVLEMAKKYPETFAKRDFILKETVGQKFYNTSRYDFKKLLDDPDNIEENFYIL